MSSPFILNNPPLPFPKTDSAPLPIDKDPTQYITASEWNTVCQDLIDVRAAIISGSYFGFDAQTGIPNVQMGLSGTDGIIWLSSSGDLYLTITSSAGLTSTKLSASAGGGASGYATIATGSNVSLPQRTKELYISPLLGFDDSGNSLTRIEHASGSVVSGSYDSVTAFGVGSHGHVGSLRTNGDFSITQLTASNAAVSGNLTFNYTSGSAARLMSTNVNENLIVLAKNNPTQVNNKLISFVSGSPGSFTEWGSIYFDNSSAINKIRLSTTSLIFWDILYNGTSYLLIGNGGFTMGASLTLNMTDSVINSCGNINPNGNRVKALGGSSNNWGTIYGQFLRGLSGSVGPELTTYGEIHSGREEWNKGGDVTSASTLTLGADGNVFSITSTNTINYITTTQWQAGSVIILIFAASLTVTNNAGSVPTNTAALLLAGSANFSATANDVLTLVYNGTNWIEVCRSVN